MRLHAQPAFLPRVVTRISNVGRLQYVDLIAAIHLQEIGSNDCGRAADLRAPRDDNARPILRRQRATAQQQERERQDKTSLKNFYVHRSNGNKVTSMASSDRQRETSDQAHVAPRCNSLRDPRRPGSSSAIGL